MMMYGEIFYGRHIKRNDSAIQESPQSQTF